MARVWLILVLALVACEHAPPARTEKKRAPVAKGADSADVRPCDFAPYHPLRMADWLSHGPRVQRVKPLYPPEAMRLGQYGPVAVRILINRDGVVEQACGDGPALLRAAAESAARQWRFGVPRLNGEAVPYIEERLRFDFVLDPSNSPKSRPPSTSP